MHDQLRVYRHDHPSQHNQFLMFLSTIFNPPRLCELGGRPFWARALSVADWATIVAWLDDVLPGKPEREFPPEVADPASQRALESRPGRTLLVWLALRHDDVTYEAARELWTAASPEEQYRLLDVLMHRRRTARADGAGGTDLGHSWFGEGMAELAVEIGVETMGRLSFDQLEWIASGGKADSHASPEARGFERAMQIYAESVARAAGGEQDPGAGMVVDPIIQAVLDGKDLLGGPIP